jgi:hemolysin III
MENSFGARRAVRDALDCPATCCMTGRDCAAFGGPVTEFPRYTAAERRADAAVHGIGLALGVVGCAVLGLSIWTRALDVREVTALGLYGIGLMTMLTCSALYNLTEDGPRKRLYRRLDHAAIFLMIAGTYTPFALVALGGAWGVALLAVVWGAAVVGIAVELLDLRRHDRLSVAAYLLLGWIIVPALGPLSAVMSSTGLVLLVAGGILYSVGAAFHVWSSMPYQNAIWHGFVLAAAGCHYTAVLRDVVV